MAETMIALATLMEGITDLVVWARSDDDGATDAGAVYILFMNADGTVASNQKISALEGGFTDSLVTANYFGYDVAGIGDYDGDNVPDIAVSAPNPDNQAIHVLHLRSNGTVKSMIKTTGINAQGLSAIGDLNGDGRIDLVAAEPRAAGGGAIRILFLMTTQPLTQMKRWLLVQPKAASAPVFQRTTSSVVVNQHC